MMSDFNAEEYNRIKLLSNLTKHSRLFRIAYELGQPIYTSKIDTLAVSISKDGDIFYLINPDFFFMLSADEKAFVIAHEALHVLFNHLELIKEYKLNPQIANIATDIVINETLVHHYGFNRKTLPIADNALFIDNVFSKAEIVENQLNLSTGFMEFYKLLIMKYPLGNNAPSNFDNHQNELDDEIQNITNQNKQKNNIDESQIDNQNNEIEQDNQNQSIDKEEENQQASSDEYHKEPIHPQSALDKLQNQLKQEGYNPEEIQKNWSLGKNELQKALNSKIEQLESPIKLLGKRKSKQWEKIVKWVNPNIMKYKYEQEESFAIPNVMWHEVLPDDFIMPEMMKIEIEDFNRIDLYFFFDTSGSCYPFKNEFFKLIAEIPTKKFNLHLFNFDTKVYPINLDKSNPQITKLNRNNGNAPFEIIEQQIQKDLKIKKIKAYPPLVCVLTDGLAPPISTTSPKHMKNWLWLIITGLRTTPLEIHQNKFVTLFGIIRQEKLIPFSDKTFDSKNPKINIKVKEGCKILPSYLLYD